MPSSFRSSESPSFAKLQANRENAKKAGRPKGCVSREKKDARALMIVHAPAVGAELVRLALHAKIETVRAAACRDVLAYAWGKPIAVDFSGEGGDPGAKVTIVNVITGVRG